MPEIDRKKLFKTLAYFIFLILIVNFTANKFYFYSSIWYLDMIVHFLGGFWVGLLCIYLFPPTTLSFKVVFNVLLLVLLVGVGWEVFEMVVNDVIAENPINYLDTFSDIFFDLAGGLCAILYTWKKLEKKQ